LQGIISTSSGKTRRRLVSFPLPTGNNSVCSRVSFPRTGARGEDKYWI
jgi:hypothetical protein